MTAFDICTISQKYQQIKMIQDQKLSLKEIKLGDFLVAMRGLLRPNNYEKSVVEYYLTEDQIIETQKEVTGVFKSVLQNTINDTEITWALDDAVDIFMTTGSGVIIGIFNLNLIYYENITGIPNKTFVVSLLSILFRKKDICNEEQSVVQKF